MKKVAIVLLVFLLSGCGTDKGLTSLVQSNTDIKHIVILEDQATRDSVLPVIEKWFEENGYDHKVVQSLNGIQPNEYVYTYSAKWSWDMATYMRAVQMKLSQNGAPMATLSFDAVNYGGMGKFGSAEKRLRILLDVLFGKISREEGDIRLGEA